MSLDLNAIKAKLNQLQRAGNNRSNQIFKPDIGKTEVRVLPYKHNPKFPFLEMYFYYNFGGKTYVSPKSFGQPDPVEVFAKSIENTGDTKEARKESWLLAKKIMPTLRVFVPVLVRGKESEGVKFWGFGGKTYAELLGFLADPEWGDFTDLEEGRDVTIEVSAPPPGKKYPEAPSVRLKPSTKPATTDPKILQLIDEMPDIEEIFKPNTVAELEAALHNYLNGGDNSTSATQSTTSVDPIRNAPSQNSPIQTGADTFDVDAMEKQFDDLFKK